MDSIDIFIQAHGFYADNGIFLPVEIGFVEINRSEKFDLITINRDPNIVRSYSERDRKENNKFQNYVHGISLEELKIKWPEEKELFSIEEEHLKAFFSSNIKFRYNLVGCFGKLQKKFLNDMGLENVCNIENYLSKKDVDPEAPYIHQNFHTRYLEKNCALRKAWTYAKIIRIWIQDRKAQEVYWSEVNEERDSDGYHIKTDRSEIEWDNNPRDKNWMEEDDNEDE